MNRKTILTCLVLGLLVIITTACATPQPTPCPTSQPQSCPTAASLAMPEISGFRWAYAGESNAIITFGAGDKCTVQLIRPVVKEDDLRFDVVANDSTYQDYIVWVSYLDPGKTLDDLKSYTDPTIPPTWLHVIGGVLTTPMSRAESRSQLAIDSTQGPLYFICQVNGPVARKTIDYLGPLEWR